MMGPQQFEQRAERLAADLNRGNEREAGAILHNELMGDPRESLALIHRARQLEQRNGVDDVAIGRDGSVAMLNKYNHHVTVVGYENQNQYPVNPAQANEGPFSQYENMNQNLRQMPCDQNGRPYAPMPYHNNDNYGYDGGGYNQAENPNYAYQQQQQYNGSWNQGGYNPAYNPNYNPNYNEGYAMQGGYNPAYNPNYNEGYAYNRGYEYPPAPPPMEIVNNYPQYYQPGLQIGVGGYGGRNIGGYGWGRHYPMPQFHRGFGGINVGGFGLNIEL